MKGRNAPWRPYPMKRSWYVYMLRCGDGTFYTGIATDVERRLRQHLSGKGSRYVRSRLPAEVVYTERVNGVRAALRREREIKRMDRTDKLKLAHDKS
jgi:putative endonuclease